MERKWLGSLSIPFSSLYHNTRIEGTFRLHSPPVLLGYERSMYSNTVGDGDSGSIRKVSGTFLNIYLTIQPALLVPEPVKEKLDCDESAGLVQHCQSWMEDLRMAFPNRAVKSGYDWITFFGCC